MSNSLLFSVLIVAFMLNLGCGDTSDGTSGTTTSDSDSDSDSDSLLDFPPVVCSGVTCPEKQICVIGGLMCDGSTDPPEWVTPDGVCAAVPQACTTVSDDELTECLATYSCDITGGVDDSYFKDGVLGCPTVDLDCF